MAENTETKDDEMQAINEKLVIAAVHQQELAETAYASAEIALKNGALYRLLAENFPDGMVLLFDRDLRHLLAGGSGLSTLGLSQEVLEGQTIWEKFAPQTCRLIEPAYRAALAGETCVLEVPFRAAMPPDEKTERLYRVHTLPVRNEWGKVFIGMAVAQDVTEQRRAEESIRWQAYHDPLTGLPNRALMRDRLDQMLAMSERSGERMALLFLDLNHFKQINDTLGHDAGDHVLKTVAARLTGCLRAEDTVARIGGDEFVLLLPSLQAVGDAAGIAQKIMVVLAEPILMNHHEMFVTASVGSSVFPEDGRDADTLLKKADAAMYQLKAGRQNLV